MGQGQKMGLGEKVKLQHQLHYKRDYCITKDGDGYIFLSFPLLQCHKFLRAWVIVMLILLYFIIFNMVCVFFIHNCTELQLSTRKQLIFKSQRLQLKQKPRHPPATHTLAITPRTTTKIKISKSCLSQRTKLQIQVYFAEKSVTSFVKCQEPPIFNI